MGIFKKKSTEKNENTVFVGANVPLQLNTYFTLYSISTGESKSSIIANLLTNFKEEYEQNVTIDQLIEIAVSRAHTIYKKESKKANFSSMQFFRDMKSELNKKGIDFETTELIIQKVRNETNR